MPRRPPKFNIDDVLNSLDDNAPTFTRTAVLTPTSPDTTTNSPPDSQPKTEQRRCMVRASEDDGCVFPSALSLHDADTRTVTDNIAFLAMMLSNPTTCCSALSELRDALQEKNALSLLRRHNKMADLLNCVVGTKLPVKDRQCHADVLYILFRDNMNSVFAGEALMGCLATLLAQEEAVVVETDNTKKTLRTSSHWMDSTPCDAKKAKGGSTTVKSPERRSHALTIPRSVEGTDACVQYTALRVLISVIQNCSTHIDSQGSDEGGTRSFLSVAPVMDVASKDGSSTRRLAVWAADAGVFGVVGDLLMSHTGGEVQASALEALEIITVFLGSTATRCDLGAFVRTVRPMLHAATETKVLTSVCRILLNMSNHPGPKSALQQRAYVESLTRLVCTSTCDDDVAILVLCLFCNVCEGDTVGSESSRRFILESGDMTRVLIQHVARHCDKTSERCSVEHSVLAAYSALLLGVVSVNSADATTCIKESLREAHLSMTSLVATLQEFILFQSEAGVLTKNALVTVHTIIDLLIEQNKIKISQ